MRWCTAALAFIIVAGLAGCGQKAAPAAAPQVGIGQNQPGTTEGADAAPMPQIPKDAQFTVYCGTIAGPDHAARAKALRGQLLAGTRLRDWYMVQGDGQTTLYYGFYSSEKDPKAREDRLAVAGLRTASGEKLFQMVCLVPLDSADPAAPPQWNLENASGHYTLQIAVYRDSPQRKEYAVQAVKEARAAGLEAYYYHGPNSSIVTLGLWPESAVRQTTEVRAEDPNEIVGVAPPSVKLPDHELTAPDGRRIRLVKPTFEVLDPTLLALMKKFPHQSINGIEGRQVRSPRTGQVRTVFDPSIVVKVPEKRQMSTGIVGGNVSGELSAPGTAQGNVATPAPTVPPKAPVQQGGRLKSIEDQ